MILTADRLCKSFGDQCVIKNVSFCVDSGEFLAIVGRSGCGKTTLLRLLAGFLTPDSGAVLLDGRRAETPDKDRLMVFQSFDQLFPWMTLHKNICYALKKTRPEISKKDVRDIASRCLYEMDLQDAWDKYPYQLSGGMKQRGAMARAMAVSPKVLLMDEPFSSLDVYLRDMARKSLLILTRATGAAVVFVTHDLSEAAVLAPRIALMKPQSHGIFAMVENTGPGMTEELNRQLMD